MNNISMQLKITYILFLFTVLFSFLFSSKLYSQNSFVSALGGEVWYELHSQNSYSGSIQLNSIIYDNPTKGLRNGSTINMFNYPMIFIGSHKRWLVDTVKLNCNVMFVDSNVLPTVLHWHEGVFLRKHMFAIQSYATSYTPYLAPFLSPPPINGWVIANVTSMARDTTANNIIPFPYNHLIHPVWKKYKNSPVIFTRVYPFSTTAGAHNDISPRFASDAVIICTSGDTVHYNPNIFDADNDSISVSWDYHINGVHAAQLNANIWTIGALPPPLNYPYPLDFDTATYRPGYAYNKPLPDVSFNANNIAAVLDSASGEIYFSCNNPGNYSAAVKVSSYRGSYLLSTTHREIFFTVFPADSNSDPKITNSNNIFTDTIYAGDSVNIPFYITDADTLQQISFQASGYALDSSLQVNGNHCGLPPCAGFSKLPSDTFLALDTGIFVWKTSCNHTSAANITASYNFNLNAKDDNCAVAGIVNQSIRIVVIKPPKLKAVRLHCLMIDTNSNVHLSWDPIADSSHFSFKKYKIWSSTNSSGPYVLIDSIADINQSTYLHVNANANSDTLFYFIETISSCNPLQSSYSDTLESLFLELGNINNNEAILSWNDIRVNNLSQYYQVYRSIDAGQWSFVDSSITTNFTDTISVCSLPVSYFVMLNDSTACANKSNICTDTFTDLIAPNTVILDTVSVNANNEILLSWQLSSSADAVAYIVYNQGQAIDTAWGVNSSLLLNYIYSDTCGNCFSISPMDSCNNVGAQSTTHCSIDLQANVDKCSKSIILSWKPNNDTSILAYDIYYKQNTSPYQYLASMGNNDSSYIHSSIVETKHYCYYVRARLSQNRSTSSNRRCIIANFSEKDNYTYLRVATVSDNNFVKLKVQSDTNIKVYQYQIERRDNLSATFENIAIIPNQNSTIWYFDDNVVDVQNNYYQYRILSENHCYEFDTSNYAQTIRLQISQETNNINKLFWNYYAEWAVDVDYYSLHCMVGGVEQYPNIIVSNTGNTEYSYIDDISQYAEQANTFCYTIEALESIGNPITNSIDTSFSNTACINRDVEIYIPNAFHPGGGINEEFKPIIPFGFGLKYRMIIFNRWGEKIFETEDINQGWNGMHKSEEAAMGVYVFIIELIPSQGEAIHRKGNFTLLR